MSGGKKFNDVVGGEMKYIAHHDTGYRELKKGDKVLLLNSNERDWPTKPYVITKEEDKHGRVKAAYSTKNHYYSIYTEPKNLIRIEIEDDGTKTGG